MPAHVTSYSCQGTVVNVERAYNSFAQLVTEYQEHSGAVNTWTPSTQYQYAPGGSSNTIRPTAVVYPNGRVLNLSYGTPGGTDDALSRIASLIDSDGVTHLADYTRLGAASIVQVGYAQPGINYSLINGSGADPYSGLDQFSRVVDCRWYATGSNTDVARIEHGYDLTSNRLWRSDPVARSNGVNQDELYSYDGLYRLAQMQRGQLNSGNNGIISGTLSFAQAWGLDATGNWGQFWENDTGSSWNLQQTRTASLFNEISGITGGWVQPAYDAAGNMVQMPQPASPTSGYDATYDAWNRLISLWSGGSVVQQNAYDGGNRRVTKLASATTRRYYYSSDWQCLEERVGSSTTYDRQFVWGLRYIDDLVLRDSPDFTPNRLFALQDPNFNVIAICDATGALQERYRYSAYGQVAFLTPAFGVESSSGYGWETLYAGYRLDGESGLYVARRRNYLPSIGWIQRDPLGSIGDLSPHAYVLGRPSLLIDGTGTLWFAGGHSDANTGEENVDHRWYDALDGIWAGEDPGGFAAGDTNVYRYCGNSPTDRTDPSGMFWGEVWGGVKGLGQGVCNLGNVVTDAAIAIPNTVPLAWNYTAGWVAPNCPYIPSPDWSKGLVTDEPDWCHKGSKFMGNVALIAGTAAVCLEANAARAAERAAAERAALREFTDPFRGIERPGSFPKPGEYAPPPPKPPSGYDGWLPPEDQFPGP